MAHLTYAAWASKKIRAMPKAQQQTRRGGYYSPTGRINNYDNYRADAKAELYSFEKPPEGYWESKEKPWHKPVGFMAGGLGVFIYFLFGIVLRSTGQGGSKNA